MIENLFFWPVESWWPWFLALVAWGWVIEGVCKVLKGLLLVVAGLFIAIAEFQEGPPPRR